METYKYYTPEIEEFHVGFEYETRNSKGEWDKQIAETSYSDQAYVCIPIPNKDYGYDSENTRVKHLDREDIESLGWEYSDIGKRFFLKSVSLVHLKIINENNQLIIMDSGKTNIGEVKFNGTIKNKSELKKLMKQLNIS